jgi:hypothetical protein
VTSSRERLPKQQKVLVAIGLNLEFFPGPAGDDASEIGTDKKRPTP